MTAFGVQGAVIGPLLVCVLLTAYFLLSSSLARARKDEAAAAAAAMLSLSGTATPGAGGGMGPGGISFSALPFSPPAPVPHVWRIPAGAAVAAGPAPLLSAAPPPLPEASHRDVPGLGLSPVTWYCDPSRGALYYAPAAGATAGAPLSGAGAAPTGAWASQPTGNAGEAAARRALDFQAGAGGVGGAGTGAGALAPEPVRRSVSFAPSPVAAAALAASASNGSDRDPCTASVDGAAVRAVGVGHHAEPASRYGSVSEGSGGTGGGARRRAWAAQAAGAPTPPE
jgi:hypothetical protein